MFPERALFEEELDAHHMRCIWAAQILTDIAVVSYMHDTCALLQMPPEGIPGLADVVQQLLCAFAVMDQYLEVRCQKHMRTSTPLCMRNHMYAM